MAKDSQTDPKHVREQKAKGGPTPADDKHDSEGRNKKKQSVKPQGFANSSKIADGFCQE